MNNSQLASEIIEKVGGKTNITYYTHCATRLRFNLKDTSLVKPEAIKSMSGVLGTVNAGGQQQVIIGPNVANVFAEVEKILGNTVDTVKTKSSIKFNGPEDILPMLRSFGGKMLDGFAGCLTPLIPMFIIVGFFSLLQTLLGPDIFNLISTNSDFYILLNIVSTKGLYFFPVFLGYSASRKFGTNPVVAMFLGLILISPDLEAIAAAGEKFNVFGIPIDMPSYANSVIPMVLAVYIMSHVERFITKISPAALKTVMIPFLTMLIILPITLIVVGPIGNIITEAIANGILKIGEYPALAFLSVALIGAFWHFIVLSGMHMIFIMVAITAFTTNGYDAYIGPGMIAAILAGYGTAVGAALKLKNKDEKALAWGYSATAILGGVSEPTLYGIGIKYKKPLISLIVGGFVGGLYAGIMGVTQYTLVPVSNFLCLTSYAGGSTMNAVHAGISAALAFSIALAITYFYAIPAEE